MSTFIDLDPDEQDSEAAFGGLVSPPPASRGLATPSPVHPSTQEPNFQPLIATIPSRQTPGAFLRGAVPGLRSYASVLTGARTAAGLAATRPLDPGPFPFRAILLVGATGAAAAYVGAGIAGLVQAGLGLPLVAVALAWSGASTLVVTSLLWQPRVWTLGFGLGAMAVAWSAAGQMAAGAVAAASVIMAANGMLLMVGSLLAWTAARGFEGCLSRWRRDRAAYDAAAAADAGRAGGPAARS